MEPLKHGIQPFWFWNGEMEDIEIIRQIGEMKTQGLTGFLIHPRQGMEIPYLSRTFFEKVRVAVKEAKRLGMEVWLYDEFPYPSGISGGKVTLDHPEYACRELTKTCRVCQGGEHVKLYAPWGKVVMARAYPVAGGTCRWEEFKDLTDFIGCGYRQDVFQMSGLTAYNKKRYFQGDLSQLLDWKAPEGQWKIYVYTERVMRHFKYFETFIDPLNPEAVRYFLKTTHEKYRQFLGDEFGKTIRGVFTDEVAPFPPENPWSPLLPGLVKEKFGLDLAACLPALTEDMGEVTARVRYAYNKVLTEQFIESWDKQVYQWCEANHLLYIGEKPILRSSQLQYVHVPGIDAGHQKIGSKAEVISAKYRANGKIVSSAAHFYKKPAALCEAFHSIGWGMTLHDAKWIFDWLTVTGIDWFITHGAYYTSDGLKKHDAPPSFFYQMPWWKNTWRLSRYTERLNRFLMEGERKVSVLLLDPVTSTWTETGDRQRKLKRDFAAFQNELLKQGVDYYIMDPQLFAQKEVAEACGKAYLESCGDLYEIVVLPFMTNLEPEAVEKLKEYAEKGGMVLTAGTVPFWNPEGPEYEDWMMEHSGTYPREIYEAYFAGEGVGKEGKRYKGTWKGRFFAAADYRETVEELKRLDREKRGWQITAPKEAHILQVQRTGPEGRAELFLANAEGTSRRVEIAWGNRRVIKELAGGESLFLDESLLEHEGDGFQKELEISLTEEMPMKAVSANLLRMGMWDMTLSDGQKGKVDSFPLIDQMEEAGMKIPIVQKDYFGCPKELEFPRIKAEYRYSFVNRLEKGTAIYLFMEPGTLLGQWTLRVNGRACTDTDFSPYPVYAPSNLGIDITKDILEGENQIKLEIKSDVSFGGIRNPLYLRGRFAVEEDGGRMVLTPEKCKGTIGNLTGCGLPFYGGRVEFIKRIPDEVTAGMGEEETVCIAIKDPDFHESLGIKAGAEILDVCPYAPYRFRVPAGILRKYGGITLCVDTSLDRMFEGEYFNEKHHRYEKVFD